MTEGPVRAHSITAKKGASVYPEPFARLVQGRTKAKLGEVFSLRNFGVNLTTLDPRGASALKHCHTVQDEFVYVLEGALTLVYGDEEFAMSAGDCMGFKAGTGIAHQIVNRSEQPGTYLEIGDRLQNDSVAYPDDDLVAESGPGGSWAFSHKNGTPY
ncbi:MAG: cupin domain-containing protein [Pseudomonadota bacterium]